MPWERAEKKEQKKGTYNACLEYALHLHKPDYERVKTLLSYAKE